MRTRAIPLLMLLLAFLWQPCLAEEAADAAPDTLRSADTAQEAAAFLLYPPEDGLADVQAGYIRLISQHRAGDAAFRTGYWLGGEEGSDLDLTLQQNRYGYPYTFHVGNMCTRAAYSMALSYLGVDVTPGSMSAMTGRRNLDPPYAAISEMVGVELVTPRAHVLYTMVGNYLTDPSYSPVYVYIRKPNGQDHALLIIGKLPEASQYLVLDPSGMWLHGEQHRIYMMAFNKTRVEVVNSTFRTDFAGRTVLQRYEGRLLPEDSAAEAEPGIPARAAPADHGRAGFFRPSTPPIGRE